MQVSRFPTIVGLLWLTLTVILPGAGQAQSMLESLVDGLAARTVPQANEDARSAAENAVRSATSVTREGARHHQNNATNDALRATRPSPSRQETQQERRIRESREWREQYDREKRAEERARQKEKERQEWLAERERERVEDEFRRLRNEQRRAERAFTSANVHKWMTEGIDRIDDEYGKRMRRTQERLIVGAISMGLVIGGTVLTQTLLSFLSACIYSPFVAAFIAVASGMSQLEDWLAWTVTAALLGLFIWLPGIALGLLTIWVAYFGVQVFESLVGFWQVNITTYPTGLILTDFNFLTLFFGTILAALLLDVVREGAVAVIGLVLGALLAAFVTAHLLAPSYTMIGGPIHFTAKLILIPTQLVQDLTGALPFRTIDVTMHRPGLLPALFVFLGLIALFWRAKTIRTAAVECSTPTVDKPAPNRSISPVDRLKRQALNPLAQWRGLSVPVLLSRMIFVAIMAFFIPGLLSTYVVAGHAPGTSRHAATSNLTTVPFWERSGTKFWKTSATVDAPISTYLPIVTAQNLNVRDAPSTNSKILKTLHFGEPVHIEERRDGWARIDNGQWVSADFISYTAHGLHLATETRSSLEATPINLRIDLFKYPGGKIMARVRSIQSSLSVDHTLEYSSTGGETALFKADGPHGALVMDLYGACARALSGADVIGVAGAARTCQIAGGLTIPGPGMKTYLDFSGR